MLVRNEVGALFYGTNLGGTAEAAAFVLQRTKAVFLYSVERGKANMTRRWRSLRQPDRNQSNKE